ncbi:hypothetical protein CYY_009283 [Polysphondylium violaceum]|uniref:E3 ubiquitin-protein ligase n=1 Tax=Polysphondylium violaceum TaxID=133409 RepID=A0A8J4PLR1_9MYCE|nr:hypothetical protein CYY_009283 [Polysphondylium violaceum]
MNNISIFNEIYQYLYNSNNNNNNSNSDSNKHIKNFDSIWLFFNQLLSIKPPNRILDTLVECLTVNNNDSNSSQLKTFDSIKQYYSDVVIKSVCGKVWNNSLVYKCLDCQVDDNCSICLDCFEEDKHIGHRFRFIKSTRGCCDCGDSSAWRKEGSCRKHSGLANVQDNDDNKNSSSSSNNNNRKPLPINTSLIFIDVILELVLIELIESSTRSRAAPPPTNAPITIPPSASHKTMITQRLIKIVNQFIEILGDTFTMLCANKILLKSKTSKNLLKYLLRPRDIEMENFVIALFICHPLRDELAMCLASNFECLENSNLSVQLFTVDAIAQQIVEQQTLTPIVECFLSHVRENKDNETDLVKSGGFLSKGYFKSLVAMSYIIRTKPSFLWLIDHPNQMLEALEALQLCQGSSENIRYVTSYISNDDFWIDNYYLEYFVGRYLSNLFFGKLLYKHAALVKETSIAVYKHYLLNSILQFVDANNGGIKWKRGVRDKLVPEYRIQKQPISFHLPLHRSLCSVLYFYSLHYGKTPVQTLVLPDSTLAPDQLACLLAEHVMRIFVLVFMHDAKTWMRNGESINKQAYNYKMQQEFFATDLHLVQYLLHIYVDPTLFYSQILDRCELTCWLVLDGHVPDSVSVADQNSITSGTRPPHRPESDRINAVVTENLLELIVHLVCERTKLADMSTEQILRRDLIHRLAVGPQTFSEILGNLSEDLENDPIVERVLLTVSDFHTATESVNGKYHLKPECWTEWTYFYPYYSRIDQQKSEENYILYFKKLNNQKEPIRPPLVTLAPTLPIFNQDKGIERIIHNDILHSILYTVIFNACSGSVRVNDRLLTTALYLVSLCLDTFDPSLIPSIANEKIKNDQFDFGFTHNIVFNFYHPVKESQVIFFLQASVHSLSSLLNHMLGVLRFDTYHPIIRYILNHNVLKQHKDVKGILSTSSSSTSLHLAQGESISSTNSSIATLITSTTTTTTTTTESTTANSSMSTSPDSSLLKEAFRKKQMEILKKFTEQQKSFLIRNSNGDEDDQDDNDIDQDIKHSTKNKDQYQPVNNNKETVLKKDYGECIVCRENMNTVNGVTNKPFGYIGFIQPHSLLSCNPLANNCQENQTNDLLFSDINASDGSFINFCSHLVHLCCHQLLVSSGVADLKYGFQCPCCRRQSNVIIKTTDIVFNIPSSSSSSSTSLSDFILDLKSNNLNLSTTMNQNNQNQNQLQQQQQLDMIYSHLAEFEINNPSRYLHIWNLVCSSLSLFELSKRKDNVKQVPVLVNSRESFQNLIKYCISIISGGTAIDKQQAIIDFKKILNTIFNQQTSQTFLSLDMFGLFVKFYLSIESINNKNNNISFNYYVSIFVIGNLIQSILVVNDNIKSYTDLYNYLKSKLIDNNDNQFITFSRNLEKQVKDLCIPFLKRILLFKTCIDSNIDIIGIDQDQDEYEILIKYIFNSSNIVLFNDDLMEIIKQWIISFSIGNLDNNNNHNKLPLRSEKEFELKVDLPLDYLKLLVNNTKGKCDSCSSLEEDISSPIRLVCLLCGLGLCHFHFTMHHSQHRIGVYMVIPESYIFIQMNKRSRRWGSIYLDQHGEEDLYFQRGNPLLLNGKRLDKLKQDILLLNNIQYLPYINIPPSRVT